MDQALILLRYVYILVEIGCSEANFRIFCQKEKIIWYTSEAYHAQLFKQWSSCSSSVVCVSY